MVSAQTQVDFGKWPKDFDSWLIVAMFLLVVAILIGSKRSPVVRKVVGAHTLDAVLFHWNDQGDVFKKRDLTRHVAVQGASGSGKSSAVALQLVRAMVGDPNINGIALGSKPEDRHWWQQRLAEAGGKKLLVFAPDSPLRLNWLDWERRAGADSRELANLMMVAGECLHRGEGGSAESEPYWRQAAQRLLQLAIEMVWLGTGQLKPTDLYLFLIGTAQDAAQLKEAEWQVGFHCQTIKAARDKPKTAMEQTDYDLAKEYFLGELPNLNSRTRSSIFAQATQILFVFTSGVCRELLATTTNVTPNLAPGEWLLVDMPQTQFGASGQFVAAALKLSMQRHILRRKVNARTPITVIFSDEFQNHITSSGDSTFLAEGRSHNGAMCILTQSLHSFFAALKGGTTGEHLAQALLSNFNTKIYCSLGDAKSAEAASALLGNRLEFLPGGSEIPPENLWEQMMRSRFSGNFNSSYQPVLQPGFFMHGLRTGGPPHFCADAVVIRPEPFANGEHYQVVAFSQK